jgi:hypothetical protein
VTLTSTTIAANRADAGGRGGRGGGLFVDASSTAGPVLDNTLIAGNLGGAGGTSRDDVSGALDRGGAANLIGDGTGSNGLSNGVNGNQIGSVGSPIDPLLAPLGDYGGPTLTMALLPGSPALNTGDPTQLGTPDQRGVTRTGHVNIGAYQASAGAFLLTAPGVVQAGVPFDLGVTAVDPFGQVAYGYTGTVSFASDDAAAVLPGDYPFQPSDQGHAEFTVTLNTSGPVHLTVTDAADGTVFAALDLIVL